MSNRICSVEGCERPFRRKDLCELHSARLQRLGSVDLPERTLMTKSPCEFEGCVNMGKTKNLCSAHYAMTRRGQALRPLSIVPPRPRSCTFNGCGRKHAGFGLCATHRRQQQAGKTLTPIRDQLPPSACPVEGCERKRLHVDMCAYHYQNLIQRWRDFGITREIGHAMYESQCASCAICRDPYPLSKLVIDHDHSCCIKGRGSCGNCVRGLLCNFCNIGIGNLRDDPLRLASAIEYLQTQ